jgi:4-amino-4-deoxy-L-arabinose transferase-like glycosyltransferase
VALHLALLLGGATVLWPYGTTLYSEAWQAAAFVWAAALLLEARADGGGARTRVIAAGVLLAVAGLTKVTSLIFAPAFVLAALADESRPVRQRLNVALTLGLGIAMATGLHLAWNTVRFGNAFDFGYDWSETVPALPARAFSMGDVPHGLLTLLIAPGKSLFLWAPLLVLSVIGFARFRRREPAAAAGIAAAMGVGLVVFAAYLFPEGGYAHGPRNLVPIVPIALLAACGPEAGQWSKRALASCGAVGVVVAIGAVSVSFTEDQALGAPGAAQGSSYYDIVVVIGHKLPAFVGLALDVSLSRLPLGIERVELKV